MNRDRRDMSGAVGRLRDWLAAARRRRVAIALAAFLPWLLPVAALAGRMGALAWWLLALPALATAAWAVQALRGLDAHWLAWQLDSRRPDMEDSAALLFDPPDALPPLARLQRARLEQRLATVPTPDLRPRWPSRALFGNAALAAVLAAAAHWLPPLASADQARPAIVAPPPSERTQTRVTRQSLEIRPPAYTGLAARQQAVLQAKVPEGAMLRWTLRLAPMPDSAALLFHDGTRLPLQRRGQDWTAAREIRQSTLYRVSPGSGPAMADTRLQRIDVFADRPPQIRVLEPDRSLSLLEDGQRTWPLVFEASDDYGLGPAQLRITLAQGSGENITVSARTLGLAGSGSATRRSYRRRLDLAGLGFAAGDDLVVRLSVSDRRTPSPQTARSASFILRWPPATGAEATGVEGMVKRTLPAYFRSQRQIIIDSEALLAQRRKLDADTYLARSDEIGVDQRILRLRYGQFLGEESTSGREAGHEDHAADPSAPMSATSDATSLLEAYGHTHDESEAATLLDAETRALLKAALDQMWQSELHLRQGHPDQALPFEYAALRLIKQVQQASRIYLARVGLALPPIDESRRLGGVRAGLQSRRDALVAAHAQASPVLPLWQALEAADSRPDSPVLPAFERWLRDNESRVPQALDLFAAIDAWRLAPDCRACVDTLRGKLWPLLPPGTPMPAARARGDRAGRAYLDGLQREAPP